MNTETVNVNVTTEELRLITTVVIGRNELREAREVCRILGLNFDEMQGKRLNIRVVPVLNDGLDVYARRCNLTTYE